MRDATCKLADSFHFLTLAKCFLDRSEFGCSFLLGSDVPAGCIYQFGLKCGHPGQPTVAAVLVSISVLEPAERLLRGLLQRFVGNARIFGDEKFEKRFAYPFLRPPAEDCRRRRTDGSEASLGVDNDDEVL